MSVKKSLARLCLTCFMAVFLVEPVTSTHLIAQSRQPSKQVDAHIKTFFSKFCIRCHGPNDNDSDVRLDNIQASFLRGVHAETWHDVLRVLNKGDMPPANEKQPTARELSAITRWIHSNVELAERKNRSSDGKVVLRRLTKYEYNYTLQDLLGIDFDFGQDLPPDPFSKDGFQNNGQALGNSPIQMEIFLAAARLALSKAIVSGDRPKVFSETVTKSYRKKKGSVSNALAPDDIFVARIMDFPRQGKVRIRVKAKADIPANSGLPLMSVSIGNKSDVKTAEQWLGSVDVKPGDSSLVYEFTTRIEQFPLPGHNPKFPGIMITVRNEPDSAINKKQKRNRKKNKGNQQTETADPALPSIHIESVEFTGPVFDSWPPQHHRQIIDAQFDAKDKNATRQLISRFVSRAFRRPATQNEIDLYVGFYEKARLHSPTIEEAIRETLAMVLISPQFLYQIEPKTDSAHTQLTQYEFASRLSYFLWSSMPDDKLLALASQQKLFQPQILSKQIDRMIADPKSNRFVNHFSDQWLNLSGMNRVAVNPEYYPEFDDRLKLDMKTETQAFFGIVLRERLSALNFLDSDFAVINRRLAKHYGLSSPPPGSTFQKIQLTASDRRGGLLTQGSILLANSNGEDSHPVRRAVWLLDRMLDSPPAPPPPDVPALESENPNFAKLSVKEQLEIHRKKEACNNCHRRIDPWGIAFEHYDAVGKWRTEVTRKGRKGPKNISVVAHAELPTGQKINGLNELKAVLLKHENKRFARALVAKLMAYSLGRSLELSDEKTVVSLTNKFADNNYVLHELITDIVQCEPFQNK